MKLPPPDLDECLTTQEVTDRFVRTLSEIFYRQNVAWPRSARSEILENPGFRPNIVSYLTGLAGVKNAVTCEPEYQVASAATAIRILVANRRL